MTGKTTWKILLFTSVLLSVFTTKAQYAVKKLYLGTAGDGFILSTTVQQQKGEGFKLSTPRFTGIVNVGLNIHYDFSSRSGIYTGLSLKNIGFIEKYDQPDSTVKRRVYALGIPLALKLGDVRYGSYWIIGGGVDFPINYREKGFVQRGDKVKFNEWFSSRTPAVMPYVFVGAHLRPVLSVKLQYYPLNFMNTDYAATAPDGSIQHPYKDYKVQLVMLTFGFDLSYRPKN